VHLRDGRACERLPVEAAEDLQHRFAKCFFQCPPDIRRRTGRNVILQLLKLRENLGREQTGVGAEDLTDLDGQRTQDQNKLTNQRCPPPDALRAACGEAGEGIGSDVDRTGDGELHRPGGRLYRLRQISCLEWRVHVVRTQCCCRFKWC
jgi:hypothetical protein